MLTTNLLLASLLPLVQAEETVLGVFIFHRHGDRTTKAYAPTTLTELGYVQVHDSGAFYRDRYVSSNASSKIYGLSTDVVKNSQLNVEAPVDTVLQNSASGFLQGLYPPVGATLGTQRLGNGSQVEAPLSGYQLIPVNSVATASSSANSENSAWLQGSSGCGNAIVSSNNYFFSKPYLAKLNSTADFYKSIQPVVNGTFTSAANTFKNAYSVYDFVHVSMIHNQSSSIPSGELLTQEALFQLQTLADVHEFNLAYNESDPIRAIAGSTLAAQIVENLNTTIAGKSKLPVAIQFGAYASFLSFFGLAQLPKVSENFTGVVNYASSMTFELVTNTTVSNTSYPSVDDISVRFLFSNGSASENPLTVYPLFGQSEAVLPWKTFAGQMGKFSVGDQATWCSKCGSTTGVCASADATTSDSSTSASPASPSSNGGMSKAVAGVIGAFVTLAVILSLEALIMLVTGLRLVSKKRLGAGQAAEGASSPTAKA